MIHTIYLDLDDVLNTFTPFVLRSLGVPMMPDDYSRYPREMNIVSAANRMSGMSYTLQSFWDAVPRRVWAEVPESAECHWLLKTCKRIVGKEIYIATSPTKDPDCLAGKLEWIQNHLPEWLHRQYFITPRKWKLAQPGALLIDDNEQNCRKFATAGGVSLRFPRPWNTARGQDPQKYLTAGLKNL